MSSARADCSTGGWSSVSRGRTTCGLSLLVGALTCLVACRASPTNCVDGDAGVAEGAVSANFDAKCYPLLRNDDEGKRLDAHEANIQVFEGLYYLYGTSFSCGFVWQKPGSPFCGFRSYRSRDMTHWQDNGLLFDAGLQLWQERCSCRGDRCGCFRPHVVYNAITKRYVLWFNGNDVPSSYHVMLSDSPAGPFREADEPSMAVNGGNKIDNPNNGDPSLYVDDDGTGYLAYTDWKRQGDIVIERLDASYTSGTGEYVRLGMARVEAPTLFKRNGIYHLLYSDPNCGLCGGTGTSWRSSSSPLGTWSPPIKLSDDSCGGQPSHVTPVNDAYGGTTYLFQSDLWDPDGHGDQRRANHYWGPLEFSGDAIQPIRCLRSFATPALAVASTE